MAGLEVGEALPLGSLLAASEEALVRFVEVPQSFLGGTLGDFVHPRSATLFLRNLFDLVQFSVEINGARGLLGFSVAFDLTTKAPPTVVNP